MKKSSLYLILTVFLAISVFFSCKRELSCEGCNQNNKPPLAIAGPDVLITLPLDSVLLDGSGSTDPDGTINGWQWTKVSGPVSFSIVNTANAKTIAKSLQTGIYQFELAVTDNDGLSAKDTVQITVNDSVQGNRPPVACAGQDQTIVLPTDRVTLDGSCSTDPENNIITYFWAKISGPASYSIARVHQAKTDVFNLTEGVYLFELKVTDAGGLLAKDTVQVTVNSPASTTCGDSNRQMINARLVSIGRLSQARLSISVASANNKILFAGGYNGSSSSRVDIFDITSNTWSTAELSEARYMIAATANANTVLFAGGETSDGTCATDAVDIYDAATNVWSTARLSARGHGLAAASVGNKVLFAGGQGTTCSGFVDRSKQVDIYDISSNTWSIATLTEGKAYMSAATWRNKVYFSGGYIWYPNQHLSKKIEVYDNSTGTWSLDSMYEAKIIHGGIAGNDKLVWAGGENGLGGYSTSCLVEIKNLTTGNSTIHYLSRPASWYSSDGYSLVRKENKIIFLRAVGNYRNHFDIYDLTTNTWAIGILPQPLPNYSSFISVNNTIYITGQQVLADGTLVSQVWRLEF